MPEYTTTSRGLRKPETREPNWDTHLNYTIDQLNTTLTALRPTSAVAETFPRDGSRLVEGATTLTTGKMVLQAIYIETGKTVTNISFMSSTTGATTPLNWWFALYDSARVLLGQTADQTTTAWGTNTFKTLALTTPFVTTYSGLHYIGEGMAATTCNSLISLACSSSVTGLAPILFGATSDTGLTATAPATAGVITQAAFQVYGYVS